MQIWDYLVTLGIVSFFYSTVIHNIVALPIVFYRTFVLKHTSEIKRPFIGNIIIDYVHTTLIAVIVIFAYRTIEDNLISQVYKGIGGLFIYMHIAKGKIDEHQIDKRVFLKEIFFGSCLIYIGIMTFPNVFLDISHIVLNTVIWLYLIPYVGFVFKIIGGFYFAGVFWQGIQSSIIFFKEYRFKLKGYYMLPAINKNNYIHKEQIDHYFTLDNEGWELEMKEMESIFNKDGWTFTKVPSETVTVYFCNAQNGMGVSYQALFLENDPSKLFNLIIGTYYPKGSLPFEDENFRSELISKCKEELGDSYKLEVSFLDFTDETYNIEFIIFKTN